MLWEAQKLCDPLYYDIEFIAMVWNQTQLL